jgi:hypothetical protein
MSITGLPVLSILLPAHNEEQALLPATLRSMMVKSKIGLAAMPGILLNASKMRVGSNIRASLRPAIRRAWGRLD